MVVIITILIAFVLNIIFLVLENRGGIWKRSKFWVMLLSLGIVLGTVIYGAA